jgi:hypothetical protein
MMAGGLEYVSYGSYMTPTWLPVARRQPKFSAGRQFGKEERPLGLLRTRPLNAGAVETHAPAREIVVRAHPRHN